MKLSARDQHRQLIVISGEVEACIAAAKVFTTALSCLWLSDAVIEGEDVLAVNKATTVLGQEYEAVVFDAQGAASFNANAFGAISGTIIGGGCLVLLTPDLEQWSGCSRFTTRFVRLLAISSAQCYSPHDITAFTRPKLLKPSEEKRNMSKDQAGAFASMLQVADGHRRRPLLLTSDRGRGKSTLMGKLAAHLLMQQRSIIVTAPSKKIAATLLQSARDALGHREDLLKGLQFLAPDELHLQKPKADLVLVDEAASIPTRLLRDFVQQHSRVIFATTEHGYEGSGRGFAIRFRKILDEVCPKWQNVRLETPFRWAIGDPLEQFVFNALLLNAEIAEGAESADMDFQQCTMMCVSQTLLLADEGLLRSIFGLLVSAHYQTRPSDLVRLLDEDNYQIFIMMYQQQVIATALMSEEGGFSESLASDIFNGIRRPQGHIVPQTLATHAGIKEAPCLLCDRVMRIAVHPTLQGRGIGSYFLRQLLAYSRKRGKVDYIATSFGATPALLTFWHKAGFTTAYMGMKRDASSGTHSVVMLQPLKPVAEPLCAKVAANFENVFPFLLADPLRSLEVSIIAILFAQFKESKLELDEAEKQLLIGFCEYQRGYESSILAIYKLTVFQLKQAVDLEEKELLVIVAKVLQKQTWSSLVTLTGVSGKKQVVALLRRAVAKFVCPTLMDK